MERFCFLFDLITYDSEDLTVRRMRMRRGVHKSVVEDPLVIRCLIEKNFLYVIKVFLRLGAPVDINTLMLAVRKGNVKCVKMLLRNISEDMKKDNSPLFSVSWKDIPNALNICLLLLQNGFNVNNVHRHYSPLCNAIKNGNVDVIEAMLMYGAKPCLSFNTCKGAWTPMKDAFVLPTITTELIVKYASLYEDYEDVEKLKKFLSYFKVGKTRPFMKYAQTCIIEVERMKHLIVSSNEVSLYDIVVSQGERFKEFSSSEEVSDNVFNILASTSLPIFKKVILKKFDKISLLNGFCKTVYSRYGCSNDFLSSLNYYCVRNLCKFLERIDLIHLWIAVTM